jgi:hypothetical protein
LFHVRPETIFTAAVSNARDRELEAALGQEELIAITMIVPVLGGLAIIWMAMQYHRQVRDMQHKERMAMIERGLVPSPETDPAAFERQTGLARPPDSQAAMRTRSAGVITIGLGVALMFLIGIAGGSLTTGVGIGGAFVVLGAAFFFNSILMARSRYSPPESNTSARQRSDPPEPPPNTSTS